MYITLINGICHDVNAVVCVIFYLLIPLHAAIAGLRRGRSNGGGFFTYRFSPERTGHGRVSVSPSPHYYDAVVCLLVNIYL